MGNKVFDITDFVDDHPGGGDLILEYGGKDVTEIMKDEISHTHSEAAYEVLDESLVGFVVPEKTVSPRNATSTGVDKDLNESSADVYVHPRTGMSCEEDLSKETDFSSDYKKHKFLDLNKPLFGQIWYGGFSKDFYLDQVHRPRHYRGGDSAPLFGNFLEPLTKTPWWVVPTLWVPCVMYGTYEASKGFSSPLPTAGYWLFGFCIWSLIEYILHRCLFHLD